MTVLVNFGAGRSHGIGEGAVVLFDAAASAAGVLFCTLSTVAIVSVDLTALLLSCLIGFSQLRGTFITTGVRIDQDILREACYGLLRPRLCEVDSQQEHVQVLFECSEGCPHAHVVAN